MTELAEEKIDKLETLNEFVDELLAKAIESDPDYEATYSLRGVVNYGPAMESLKENDTMQVAKFLKIASDSYFKAIELNPKNPFHYYDCGSCLYELWRIKKEKEILNLAKDCFEEFIKFKPNNESGLLKKACVYTDLGEYAKAREIAEKIIQINPEHNESKILIQRMDAAGV